MEKRTLILINLIMFCIGIDLLIYRSFKQPSEPDPQPEPYVEIPVEPESPPPPPPPINYDIGITVPPYLSYDDMVAQLNTWNQEAPELTEVGTYGKSSKGKDLYYIRINNSRITDDKPVVLIQANIHGNESWAGSTVTAYIGTILDKYGDDEEITKLVDSRDLYFVPIISPDTHPHRRHVDGVDPNRNYPTQRSPNKQSIAPIQAIRDFFLSIKADAVISGHTSGEVYLYPWGDSRRTTPNDSDYKRILGEMSRLSGYSILQACYLYGRPIYGTEMDWYHRNGAFAIVIEYGNHQRTPNDAQIQSCFDKTFGAVLHFIEEAPKVEVKQSESWRRAA